MRKEPDGIVRYAHIGTGNYNRVTAQVYTDLGLFTAEPGVVDEVTEVFNYLTGYSSKADYRALLVAPLNLRSAFTHLVEREAEHARAGQPARIIIKNNSVADPELIRVLYRASQAGVRIDMIVRGVCCLRPGIPGVSDNIRVRSIVGRFLEHSRLYSFENGGDPEVVIGSADLMERNLDRRVETCASYATRRSATRCGRICWRCSWQTTTEPWSWTPTEATARLRRPSDRSSSAPTKSSCGYTTPHATS